MPSRCRTAARTAMRAPAHGVAGRGASSPRDRRVPASPRLTAKLQRAVVEDPLGQRLRIAASADANVDLGRGASAAYALHHADGHFSTLSRALQPIDAHRWTAIRCRKSKSTAAGQGVRIAPAAHALGAGRARAASSMAERSGRDTSCRPRGGPDISTRPSGPRSAHRPCTQRRVLGAPSSSNEDRCHGNQRSS